MSDRINDMAAALVAALGKYGTVHDAGDGFTTLTIHHDDMPRIARRLLDAMDAEPRCPECGGAGGACTFCGGTGDWPRTSEPTEAEVAAARHEYIIKHDAYIEAAKANAECQCYARDDYPECVERIYENAGHEAMRAALLAARKARP